MSESTVDKVVPFISPAGADPVTGTRADDGGALPLAAQYGLSLVFVALATVIAFVVKVQIAAPNLTLIYVLPVVGAAITFGWGPALMAAVTSVLAFDFFFTEPYYSFRINSPSDIWAAALLLVIAAIVSTLANESRRRGVEAQRAAEQADALQSVTHAVLGDRPDEEVIDAAATALCRIFRAPSVIFQARDGDLRVVGGAGKPKLTRPDDAAARGALATGLPARAGTYPYDDARFSFWPVVTASGCSVVLGIDLEGRDKPAAPERFMELVGSYLAIAFGPEGRRKTAKRS